MKKTKIAYWVTTSIIFGMEGIMPALTFQTELAKQGVLHLGYPLYFGNTLMVFKILGAVALILSQVPKRFKELAYAGFLFNFLFASISHFAVDGLTFEGFFPLLFIGLLWISFSSYQTLQRATKQQPQMSFA